MKFNNLAKLLVLTLIAVNPLYSQIPSFLNKSAEWKGDLGYVNVNQPTEENLTKIQADPYNYAIAIRQAVDLADFKSTSRYVEGKERGFYYLGFHSKNAKSLALRLKNIILPDQTELYFLNPVSNEFLGPFTNEDIAAGKSMFSGFLSGAYIVMEVSCPLNSISNLKMDINALDYGFDKNLIEDGRSILGFGEALSCEVNVNCPDNTHWQEVRKSVCRITVVTDQATYWCSGTLINNTSEDKHPYVLTAKHCYFNEDPQYDMWVFDFAYESDGCANPASAPGFNSIFGAEIVAERTDSDFLLVELDNSVPDSYDVVYAGWDRGSNLSDTSAMIGHPVGDIKKISIDYDPAEIHPTDLDFGVFLAPANHFFELEFDLGIFEGGSSGGPMLNEEARLVGQLTGGFADACNSVITYYGMFSRSWNDGANSTARLKEWLDPLDLNPLSLDMLIPVSSTGHSISGSITFMGNAVSNVDALLTGGLDASESTDSNGAYEFEDLTSGLDYSLNFSKNNDLTNGVSTFDAVLIQKHILGISTINDPYLLIAGDINNNGSVSTLDIVFMQKVILGIDAAFPNNESWRFVPADYIFDDPTNPFASDFPEGFDYFDLNADEVNQDLIGIKVGDINGNADPNL